MNRPLFVAAWWSIAHQIQAIVYRNDGQQALVHISAFLYPYSYIVCLSVYMCLYFVQRELITVWSWLAQEETLKAMWWYSVSLVFCSTQEVGSTWHPPAHTGQTRMQGWSVDSLATQEVWCPLTPVDTGGDLTRVYSLHMACVPLVVNTSLQYVNDCTDLFVSNCSIGINAIDLAIYCSLSVNVVYSVSISFISVSQSLLGSYPLKEIAVHT